MKRKISLLLSVLALTFVVACSSEADATETTSTEATETVEETETTDEAETEEVTEETSEESADEEFLTVTHSMGTVDMPINPEKIVVMDLGALDIIDALGSDVEVGTVVASLPTYLEDSYGDAVNVGGLKTPDLETIFEFQPDAIIMSGRQADYYEDFSEIAPTMYIDLDTTQYMEDWEDNVTELSIIVDEQDAGTEIINNLEDTVADAQEKAAATDDNALIIMANSGSLSAYGPGSRFGIIHDLIGIAPADENIDDSTHGQEASFEYIADINPDILFVVDRGVVAASDEGAVTAQDTLDNELVASTNAGQNDEIVYLDPVSWYTVSGGATSLQNQINEVLSALE